MVNPGRKGHGAHGLSLDKRPVFLRVLLDGRDYGIKAGCVFFADRECVHLVRHKTIIEAHQCGFHIFGGYEQGPAFFADTQKRQAFTVLNSHVLKVAALHELGPVGDKGKALQNTVAGFPHIYKGDTAYPRGPEVKISTLF